ncbi:MAG: N-acetyl-gamma-glutamyl-phosphate reductase [Solirubrobacterales bacterium]
MINAGIIGATGYGGQQLAWFLSHHTGVTVRFLCSNSYVGMDYSSIYGNYKGVLEMPCISMHEVYENLNKIDVLFLAMPHGKSFEITKAALSNGVKVIDLGADYRIKDKDTYEEWYKVTHEALELLDCSVYGLPELNRDLIKSSNLIANPGCYCTASILAMAPLVKNKLINLDSIIIDAKSGVSGAGRGASTPNLFCECNESIKAYGIGTHRHTPEIEQVLSGLNKDDIKITFTPHLTPMNRGILAVCYSNLTEDVDLDKLYDLYRDFYKDEFFIKVIDTLPETRYVKGTNMCHIGIRVDKRTKRVIVVSAIDNLIKGAAGQAVQNMNIIFGIKENTSLELPAMVP